MATSPEKSEREQQLDAQVKRFEQRMAAEEAEKRPPFTQVGTVQNAEKVVKELLDRENNRLKNGSFQLEAQRQALREKIEDLGWLVKDLEQLRNILVSRDD